MHRWCITALVLLEDRACDDIVIDHYKTMVGMGVKAAELNAIPKPKTHGPKLVERTGHSVLRFRAHVLVVRYKQANPKVVVLAERVDQDLIFAFDVKKILHKTSAGRSHYIDAVFATNNKVAIVILIVSICEQFFNTHSSKSIVFLKRS